MMPAFAVAAENRQSGIRLLSVADAARPGGAREVPPAQPVLALFLRGCKQPNLSSVDFGCKIRCLLRSGQARGWLLAMEAGHKALSFVVKTLPTEGLIAQRVTF